MGAIDLTEIIREIDPLFLERIPASVSGERYHSGPALETAAGRRHFARLLQFVPRVGVRRSTLDDKETSHGRHAS